VPWYVTFSITKGQLYWWHSNTYDFLLVFHCNCVSFSYHFTPITCLWFIVHMTTNALLGSSLMRRLVLTNAPNLKCLALSSPKIEQGSKIMAAYHHLFVELQRLNQRVLICIYKAIENFTISSTAANWIVARLYTWTWWRMRMKMVKVRCHLQLSN